MPVPSEIALNESGKPIDNVWKEKDVIVDRRYQWSGIEQPSSWLPNISRTFAFKFSRFVSGGYAYATLKITDIAEDAESRKHFIEGMEFNMHVNDFALLVPMLISGRIVCDVQFKTLNGAHYIFPTADFVKRNKLKLKKD